METYKPGTIGAAQQSELREKALEYAVQWNFPAEVGILIRNAKAIEAYLSGDGLDNAIEEVKSKPQGEVLGKPSIAAIEEMVAERRKAIKSDDSYSADVIQNTLLNHGIRLEDTREGTSWTRV